MHLNIVLSPVRFIQTATLKFSKKLTTLWRQARLFFMHNHSNPAPYRKRVVINAADTSAKNLQLAKCSAMLFIILLFF
jgi:hypothetical protein